MKRKYITTMAALCVFGGMGLNAVADTTDSTGNQSVETEKSFLDRLSDYGTLNYFGTFRGGPLNNMGSSLQPNVDGSLDPNSPLHIENMITAGYKFTKNLSAGAMVHFYYFPVGNPAGTGQRITMLDPTLYVARSKVIDYQGFQLDLAGRLQLPTSAADGLIPSHLATAVSAVFNAHYDTLSSNLTIGCWGYLKGYIPSSDSPDNARTYKIVAAPYANYQLTSNFALTLWVDLFQAGRNGGTGLFSGLQNGPVDIEPGISWDITKNITFNPILNIYPAHPTLASTSIQANIIAKAF